MKHKLSFYLPALLALSAVVFAAAPASAKQPRYTLTATEHTNQKTGTSTYTQTLRNRRTGRVIWVRHFPGAFSITWSKDHKAVVFVVGPKENEMFLHQGDIKLGIWQEGKRVQTFFTQPIIHYDYIEGFFWSPDKKHLLVRAGNSGMDDSDRGDVSCLTVKTRQVVDAFGSSHRVRWVDNQQVKYWPIIEAQGRIASFYESSKPRLWRLPKGF